MSPDLGDKLKACFPQMFEGLRPRDPIAMFWIECDNGWFDLLRDCIEKIKKISEKSGVVPTVSQIKEKYGTLRFYIYSATDEMRDVIDQVERASAKICEQCGSNGSRRDDGWIYTMCDNCWKSHEDTKSCRAPIE